MKCAICGHLKCCPTTVVADKGQGKAKALGGEGTAKLAFQTSERELVRNG